MPESASIPCFFRLKPQASSPTPFLSCLLVAALMLAGCSGGDPATSTSGADNSNINCTGSCATVNSNLTAADVQVVLAQGIAEAQAQGVNATLAVVDRVGNVLAVYRMGDPTTRVVTLTTTAATGGPVSGGLEGIQLPSAGTPNANLDTLAAIAKAVTGAYLSSEGNAFSSRTASQIVQEHFNPGEVFQPSGPLFGVQFSQLACSDFISQAITGGAATVGPQRSPLGLSGDPGGFPLYKGGTVVGGVGILADGIYGIDRVITDIDSDLDETIAVAAAFGFAAPTDRRGDLITIDGKTARFTDVEVAQLKSTPGSAPAFNTIPAGVGMLTSVLGYFDGTIRDGTAFGQPASGIRPDGDVNYPGQDAFVFVDAANALRFPPIAGTDGASALSQLEVQTLLRSALDVANRTRAQIRRPTGSQARVTISVVDTQGVILGMVRTRDAPVFGADVSLQKARTAALLSSTTAAAFFSSLPNANYLVTNPTMGLGASISIASYVTNLRAFMGDPNQLGDGRAFTDRAVGNLARAFYPDGIDDAQLNGPFSKPRGQWSVFSTGIQFDVANNAILQHVLFTAGAGADVAPGCAGVSLAANLAAAQTITGVRAGNGLQIFPGSVPIYRGSTLVGGIGVSGDGVDQDDMVAALGLKNAGQTLGSIGNAPMAMRADVLTPQGTRLRYVQCPQSPFITGNDDNVCGGL